MSDARRLRWLASARTARVAGWVTAQWVVQAQVLPRQDDECAQSKLVDEPLAISISAWDSGEPATNYSAARAGDCSRVDWKSQPWRPLHRGLSRLRSRMTIRARDVTRWGAWRLQG